MDIEINGTMLEMTQDEPLEVVAIFRATSQMVRLKAELLRLSALKKDFDELVKLLGQWHSPVFSVF